MGDYTKAAPMRIYFQTGETGGFKPAETTWSMDRERADDVEYIRADLALGGISAEIGNQIAQEVAP